MGWFCAADLKLIFRDFLPVGWVSLEKHWVPGLFGVFLLLFGEKKENFLSSVQLGFLELWDFLDLLTLDKFFKERNLVCQTFSLQSDRMFPFSQFLQDVSYIQAELEGQVCRISQWGKRFKGAGAVSVLWLSSSCCCSVSAHAAPIGMFVLITLLWFCKVGAHKSGLIP